MTVLHCGQIEERNAKQAQPKHCLAPIHKQNAKKQGVSQKSSIHVGSLKQRTTTNNPDRLHTHGENKLICVHTGNDQKNNLKIAQMLWKFHTPTRAKVPPRSTHPYRPPKSAAHRTQINNDRNHLNEIISHTTANNIVRHKRLTHKQKPNLSYANTTTTLALEETNEESNNIVHEHKKVRPDQLFQL
jgi:hypothetical protein